MSATCGDGASFSKIYQYLTYMKTLECQCMVQWLGNDCWGNITSFTSPMSYIIHRYILFYGLELPSLVDNIRTINPEGKGCVSELFAHFTWITLRRILRRWIAPVFKAASQKGHILLELFCGVGAVVAATVAFPGIVGIGLDILSGFDLTCSSARFSCFYIFMLAVAERVGPVCWTW